MSKLKNNILEYSAVFEPAEEGGYNVSFPSFPGCVTFGKNFEEAKGKASEVLELWLAELASQGEKIPATRHYPIVDQVKAQVPKKAKLVYAPNNC